MKLNVKTKIILIVIVILFFAVGANTLINNYFFKNEYSDALQSKTLVIGRDLELQLDRILALGIPLVNLIGFEKQCQEVISNYGDISNAMVVDINGKILFHNDPLQHGESLRDSNILNTIKDAEESIQISFTQEREYYNIIVPVFGMHNEHLGAVILELPTEAISNKTNKIMMISILIIILSSLIAVIVSIFLARSITYPLKKLIQGTHAIARGKLDFEIKPTSKDEIGELAQSFDDMRLGLKDRNDLLNSLLNTFKGKFGNLATILVRKNVQELIKKNPRIEKILPKSLGISVTKAKRLQREKARKKDKKLTK